MKNFITIIRDRYFLYRYILPFLKKNKDRDINEENTLCIFSHPRGGSTWLAELLSSIEGAIYFDEPLMRNKIISTSALPDPAFKKVQGVADLNFYYEQPIPENAIWPEAVNLFTEILSGRSQSIGLYDETGLKKLKKSGVYISKINYGHLLMHWLIKHFNFKSIVLTRHPCAVINSQLKMKWFSESYIDDNLPDFRYNEVYKKYSGIYEKITTIEEYLAFMWAIKVKESILSNTKTSASYLITSYEGLVSQYDHEMGRIFEYLNMSIPEAVYDHQYLPSISSTRQAEQRIKNKDQLGFWKQELKKSQIRSILNVIEKFEIDLYSENKEPDYNRLYNPGINNSFVK